WAFPHGKGRVRLGVGVIRPDVDVDAREYLDTFAERLPSLATAFEGAGPVEYHTGLFPSVGPVERFVGEGLLATGEHESVFGNRLEGLPERSGWLTAQRPRFQALLSWT